jgi:hypothetical protein
MTWYKTAKKKTEKLTDKEVKELSKSQWVPIKSSWIAALAYHKPLGLLEIKLKNGSVYGFGGVPESIFKRFMRSKSKGQFFNRIIKPTYKKTN